MSRRYRPRTRPQTFKFDTVEWLCAVCEKETSHKEHEAWWLLIRCTDKRADGEDFRGYVCSLACLSKLAVETAYADAKQLESAEVSTDV